MPDAADQNPGDPAAPQSPGAMEVARRLGPAAVWAAFCAFMPLIGSIVLFANITAISRFLTEDRTRGLLVYIGAFAITAGLALLPTYAQAIVGGWAFGLKVGLAAAMTGFLLAAVIGYEVGRGASGNRVDSLLAEHPKWKAVRDALVGSGFWKTLIIVTLVRLPPNSPFALTNLVMAGTKVNRVVYLVGTAIGMLPRTAAWVYLGTTLKELTKESVMGARPGWYIAAMVISTVVVLLILAEIGKRGVARMVGTPAPPSA